MASALPALPFLLSDAGAFAFASHKCTNRSLDAEHTHNTAHYGSARELPYDRQAVQGVGEADQWRTAGRRR